jgi:hypothetical protein
MMATQSKDSRRHLASTFLTGFGIAALLGCGHSPTSVHGHVTLDGNPLNEAVVLFVPLDPGRKKTGAEIENGNYKIAAEDGLLPGRYRVEIADNPPLNGAQRTKSSVPPVHQRRKLPARYAHQSPLSANVSPSSKDLEFNFDLTNTP